MAAVPFSCGLIPACAGKTAMRGVESEARGAHPRMRGENFKGEDREIVRAGSSPHARGKQPPSQPAKRRKRLIPACAGKTKFESLLDDIAKAHPRMRGENKLIGTSETALLGSSPHARGKRRTSIVGTIPVGLIPACAGKTVDLDIPSCSAKAHPRMRGENP